MRSKHRIVCGQAARETKATGQSFARTIGKQLVMQTHVLSQGGVIVGEEEVVHVSLHKDVQAGKG